MIIFKNPGLIDLTAATTLGVNVKEGSDAIGQFGTGLKCAIAVILRLGGRIDIYRGRKAYSFSVKPKTVRGKQFRVVTMNGRELGFTDQYAGHWLPWMAYRELWSNCRDENGTVLETLDSSDFYTQSGHTIIAVDCKEIKASHDERHKIVLQTSPLVSLSGLEVHAGETDRVYYKGIRVADVPNKRRSMYTYCLTGSQTLTEDRTLAYQWMLGSTIVSGLVGCTNRAVVEDVLTASHDHWEHHLPWDGAVSEKPSPQFMEIAEGLRSAGKLTGGALKLFKALLDTTPGYVSPYAYTPNDLQETVIVSAALELLEEVGVFIPRSTIKFKSDRVSQGITLEGDVIVVPSEELDGDATSLAVSLLVDHQRRANGGVRSIAYRALTGEWPRMEVPRSYDPYSVTSEPELSF